jgi:hypothetical protein
MRLDRVTGQSSEQQTVVSDSFTFSAPSESTANPTVAGDDTPPKCPSCHRRLVMLAMHWIKDEDGASVRQQLWGCPRGHATAHRLRGRFSGVELFETLND